LFVNKSSKTNWLHVNLQIGVHVKIHKIDNFNQTYFRQVELEELKISGLFLKVFFMFLPRKWAFLTSLVVYRLVSHER